MTVVELTGSKAVVQLLASRDALWRAYILDPCILGKMLGANGGKLTFWPPQPQEPLVPWGQAIKPSSLASWLQDALGLKEIR